MPQVFALLLFAFSLSVSPSAFAQSTSPKPLAVLDFLVGAWETEPAADKSSGRFTFAYDADHSVLVRRNHAEYPASATRGSSKHDDLMVIFADPESEQLRASYWDNEGHIIAYKLTVNTDGLDLVSDIRAGAPRFRLRYRRLSADRLAIEFEIAPPDKPDAFSPYLSGRARRVASTAPEKGPTS